MTYVCFYRDPKPNLQDPLTDRNRQVAEVFPSASVCLQPDPSGQTAPPVSDGPEMNSRRQEVWPCDRQKHRKLCSVPSIICYVVT